MSAQHLKPKSFDWLNENTGVNSNSAVLGYRTGSGWIFSSEAASEADDPDGVPEDFREVCEYAGLRGYDFVWINLDEEICRDLIQIYDDLNAKKEKVSKWEF